MSRTGTLSIDDLLAVHHQSAAEFGLDNIADILQRDLQAHNQLVTEMMSDFAEVTTHRQRIYGASNDGTMVKTDEFGRAPTSRPTKGSEVAFPLHLFQFNLGWTNTYFKVHTPQDMAKAQQNAQQAHLRAIQNELRQSIFKPTNYTFEDHLVDRYDLAVKRFLNADGFIIPDGPNAETFDGSIHTHYNANASHTAAAVLALIHDVVEHGHGNMIKLYINRANEVAFRGLTGFNEYHDPRLLLGTHANQAGGRLDITRLDNRAIGIFDAAEVWVKPWVPNNYCVALDIGDPNKGLCFRQRDATTMQGLMLASEIESFPLHTQYMTVEFGIGAWTRTNGAVLQFNNAAYQDPF